MNAEMIAEILRKNGKPMTFKEIYESFKEMYDVSIYVDFTDAIRSCINRNTPDRVINITNSNIFYACLPKNSFGQRIGLCEWIRNSKREYLNKDEEKDNLDKANIDDVLLLYVENKTKTHIRNLDVKITALTYANYLCEYDEAHFCFKRKNSELNYTEVHHIIPLSAQELDKFKNVNLDCVENVISLCSNCHNILHYGKDYDKILRHIYTQRKERLKNVGLDISFDELLEFYR